MSNVPSIPSIPGNIDPQLYQVLTAVKQVLDSSQGNALVTQNEMSGAISSAIDGVSGQAGIPGQTGANGEPGGVGPVGDAYILDITGGRTTISYDTNGAFPLPPLTGHPFGYLFYKNGVVVTDQLTYSWYIRDPGTSLLSGTGSISTFTPTLASTFDAAKADNVVMLTVNYGGLSFTASEPVAITKIGTAGLSPYSVVIESTNGNEFRVGQSQTTLLIAHIFQGETEVTDLLNASQFRWRRVSIIAQAVPHDDATWNALYASGYKQISVDIDAVTSKATFFCDIISIN